MRPLAGRAGVRQAGAGPVEFHYCAPCSHGFDPGTPETPTER